jgi:uncharacterized repeat protein (TIGR03806 family)
MTTQRLKTLTPLLACLACTGSGTALLGIDGAVLLPDGAVQLPDGSVVQTDGGPIVGQPDASEPADVDAGQYGLDARPPNPTCVAPAPPPNTSAVQFARVFSSVSLSAPIFLTQAPGEPDTVYVVERNGRIKSFPKKDDVADSEVKTVLDIVTRVDTEGEGGLLSMAFHPNWAQNREAFVSYTENGVANGSPLRSVIARFKSNDGGKTLDPTSEQRVLTVDQPAANHNGGHIAFGNDGFLYIGFGDGGGAGDPYKTGQPLNSILGKFVRIDVDVPFAQKYKIPASNPYAAEAPCNLNTSAYRGPANAKCAEIYASGMRNPWRFSVDNVTGELWAGDVGQGEWEEVDKVVLGGNYGWSIREGAHCYNAQNCNTAGLIDPVVEYDHGEGKSITGGYVYRGSSVPSMVGRYIFGDFSSSTIWAVGYDPVTGKAKADVINTGVVATLASFGQTLDGEVYAVNIGAGAIFQLKPQGAQPVDTFPKLLSQTGCFDSANPQKPVAALIPYAPAAPFWSDNAKKERHFAIPDGTQIALKADGDFDFPNGTVTSKTFYIDDKRVETRLFMRHMNGTWAGYSYEWNDAQTEATLLPAGKTKKVGNQTWTYPSRGQCLTCHTAVANYSLGLEVAQLDSLLRYAPGRVRNQMETLSGLGFLKDTRPPGIAPLVDPFGDASIEQRARSYLHTNCSGCHRQNAGQGPADFRASLSLKDMKICNATPLNGDVGVSGAKIFTPAEPTKSTISLRMRTLGPARMPQLGTVIVDEPGSKLVDDWISSVASCPQ